MRMHHFPKITGTTTVGERGQVVIPAEVRKSMNIKVGEKFLVFCKHNRFIGLIRATEVDDFLDKISARFTDGVNHIKQKIKEHGL